MCRTGVKRMGHPTVAQVPSTASGEDPSRKRKADEVVTPADGSKKAKGDDIVTVSDDTAVAPAGPAVEAAASTKEGVSLPGTAEATSFGAGASIATFPRFVTKAAAASGAASPSLAPGTVDAEVDQRRGHTPALLASVDAMQLHGMLGAAIQVYPVPEDQVGVLQRLDSYYFLVFYFLIQSPSAHALNFSGVGTWEFLDRQSPSAHSLNFSGWALRRFVFTDFFDDMQGLQLESADRLAAQQRAEKELTTIQEANKELQAVAAKAEETRQELVPAGELEAARSALGAAEQRVADLERELREAREEASSADGRARAAIAAAEEDRKVSEVLIAGLQDDHTSLQCFITGLARPLLGECIFPFR
jgi:hypothetical protein